MRAGARPCFLLVSCALARARTVCALACARAFGRARVARGRGSQEAQGPGTAAQLGSAAAGTRPLANGEIRERA